MQSSNANRDAGGCEAIGKIGGGASAIDDSVRLILNDY